MNKKIKPELPNHFGSSKIASLGKIPLSSNPDPLIRDTTPKSLPKAPERSLEIIPEEKRIVFSVKDIQYLRNRDILRRSVPLPKIKKSRKRKQIVNFVTNLPEIELGSESAFKIKQPDLDISTKIPKLDYNSIRETKPLILTPNSIQIRKTFPSEASRKTPLENPKVPLENVKTPVVVERSTSPNRLDKQRENGILRNLSPKKMTPISILKSLKK